MQFVLLAEVVNENYDRNKEGDADQPHRGAFALSHRCAA
jgi:hypothetical protein